MGQNNNNKDRQVFWLTGVFVIIAILVFSFAIQRMRMTTDDSPIIENPEKQPQKPAAGKFNIIRVIDGDSLLMIGADGIKLSVRLRGIDAPELGQPHGLEAKQALSSIVASKSVSLNTLSKGKYGRYVANVQHGEVLVNQEMVIRGHAWCDQVNSFDKNLYTLELEAKKQKIGLWGVPNPVPPWVWRKNSK